MRYRHPSFPGHRVPTTGPQHLGQETCARVVDPCLDDILRDLIATDRPGRARPGSRTDDDTGRKYPVRDIRPDFHHLFLARVVFHPARHYGVRRYPVCADIAQQH